MLKLFNHSRESRAVQIWQILIGKAHNRQTITYGQLANLLSFPDGAAVAMAQLLDPIMCFCIQNSLPSLTILVVNDKTGSPGKGLIFEGAENSEREKVFKHNWFDIHVPSEEDFAEAKRQGI